MSKEVIEIDGSLLEGGGQILRLAVTISVLTRTPIRVCNIRAGRRKPGLAEQHLKGLELVKDICNGKLIGGSIGSTKIEFWPGKVVGGNYYAAVKTAGSIGLLLQIALPCTFYADSDITLTLEGGTNADMAPQIDYTTQVFRPVLEKFGATFEFDIVKRGYFPRGGGKVVVHIKPVHELQAVEMLDLGKIIKLHGWSYVAGTLPIHLAQNMAKGASNHLRDVFNHAKIEQYKENPSVARDNSSGINLVAESDTGCILGGSALGRRGESPNQIGIKAADEILQAVKAGACVDEHGQDQIIIFMALAKGTSLIKIGKITMHTETAIYITERLLNVKFLTTKYEDYCIIECCGIGMTT